MVISRENIIKKNYVRYPSANICFVDYGRIVIRCFKSEGIDKIFALFGRN